MADIPAPRSGRFYWSAYQHPEGDTRPIDPLGFDMYAERLGNVLLPGITGRTTRVRYLGMVCAGLLLVSDELVVSHERLVHARRNAFLPFERGWALAVCETANGELKRLDPRTNRAALKPEFRNLRGANNVLPYWREQRRRGIRVRPPDYVLLQGQAAQGGLGAYLVTLARAGFIERSNLRLREPGRRLADAFLDGERRNAHRLKATDAQTWTMLRRLGEVFDLRRPSTDEINLLTREIFDPKTGMLASAVTGLGTIPHGAESALRRLAAKTSHPLASAASYTLLFDPFRQSALRAFARLGEAVTPAGVLPASKIPDDATAEMARAMRWAERLAETYPPAGLAEIQGLATRVAGARDPAHGLDVILAWHKQYRAPWLARDGANYVLGRRGNFDLDPDFHGYTVPSFFSLLEDLAPRGRRHRAP